MAESDRPDPDILLAAINKEQQKKNKGRLYIFFGMSAGVGKTYAMLQNAHARKNEGIDVVIGAVDTHGRAETIALLDALPLIPRKKVQYRSSTLEEMDLDEILKRKPQLVIVDELAHTNVPGSRHNKRWQDVFEILDNGIDVLTALNVQHIESRRDVVEQITGIKIRESVPDSILERAHQIQLIDISPPDLLQRLKEGKVYLGEKAEAAAQNFFKEDKLTALREIALRLTAEKVDYDLQSYTSTKELSAPWRATERLLVAVSHSPYSERLIRATRRLAFNLEAPWIAVNVDTGQALAEEDKVTLAKNITLARELGGEVITTADTDTVEAIKRIAIRRHVTQIIIGRPTKRWVKDIIERGTLLDRLVRESGEIDVHVLRQETPPTKNYGWFFRLGREAGFTDYWQVTWVVAIAAMINEFLVQFIGYRAVGFIFLLAVLATSLFVSLGPIVFAAILSVLVWDYFFIPPAFTFFISQPEDYMMCLAYLATAFITGSLTRRTRRQQFIIHQREERTSTLYEIVRDIAAAPNKEAAIKTVSQRLGSILHGKVSVALKNQNGELPPFAMDAAGTTDVKEAAVVKWAFDNKRHAGWSTDTLSGANALYIPLRGPTETVGIMAYWPLERHKKFLREEENLLFTVARQLAVSMEREYFLERSRETMKLQESEKLHQAILNSVSHEIRTPLTAIMGSASALQNAQVNIDSNNRDELTQDLVNAAERLNRVVENLLDMSRLSSGVLSLKKDWNDIHDLLSTALRRLKKPLEKHTVKISLPPHLPLLRVDFRLMEQVISNLLVNAALYTPPNTTIEIQGEINGNELALSILDEGPGIPKKSLSHIFEKFYRAPGAPAGGTGVGLTISKSIVEAHGGHIEASNRASKGAKFSITLPIENQPEAPKEKSL